MRAVTPSSKKPPEQTDVPQSPAAKRVKWGVCLGKDRSRRSLEQRKARNTIGNSGHKLRRTCASADHRYASAREFDIVPPAR